jgi:hypothetical protein
VEVSNTHSDYKVADGDRVTNTRYNETDFKTGLLQRILSVLQLQ